MKSKNRLQLTKEFVNECFEYMDGKLFWKKRPRSHFKNDNVYGSWNTRYSGKEAGTVVYTDKERIVPRVFVALNKKDFPRSVLIWILHNGNYDAGLEIDHKNLNTIDDKIDNLRLATRSENACNQGITKKNTSGARGVSWCNRENKWIVHICKNKKQKHVTSCDSKEEAMKVYEEESRKLHGEFSRTS